MNSNSQSATGCQFITSGFPQKLRERSVLVVAHPDDETLWFSSVLPYVQKIIICYNAKFIHIKDFGESAENDFPSSHAECLNLPGFSGYHPIHFKYPITNRYGILVFRSISAAWRYCRNGRRLYQLLAGKIPEGFHVFTHNPWGEYGHEEHVQVSTILQRLALKKNWTLWFSNYASNKVWKLVGRNLFGQTVRCFQMPVDISFVKQMKKYYETRGAWTWNTDWQWFPKEAFWNPLEVTLGGGDHVMVPLNLFRIDW